MKKKVTLQEIADHLGVTKVTVSRALSDNEGVSEELRTKIKGVARELGYYQQLNRGQRIQKNGIIGIIAPEVFLEKDENFYTRLYKNLYTALKRKGYLSILDIVTKDDEKNGTIPSVCQQMVEGIILLGQLEKHYVEKLQKLNIPMILVDFYYRGIELDSVITDNVYGMYEVTNYLIDKNHKKIGFVGNNQLTSSISDRYLGYCKAMIESNLEIVEQFVVKDRDLDGNPIDLILPAQLPTAFVCNSDQAARRLIEQLQVKNIRVPEDVSVIGFDDVWHSLMVSPKITTVKVLRQEMAQYTVEQLLERIQSQELVTRRIVVPTEIVERDSVKKWINKY